ncbi:DNA mismatch repair protein [Nocardia halotolerans]|uniref:DNA mismatch repair protein n=1 Tax=Nocardia halotolerans TaxID=1755878 RepID=A0ABV8VDP9_9NOCA
MQVNLLDPAHHALHAAVHGEEAFGDLGIDLLCDAMAGADPVMLEAVREVLAAPVTDPEVIRYRHAVLADCRAHPVPVRELYAIANRATAVKRWKVGPAHHADGKLLLALQPLTELVGFLRALRDACDRAGPLFDSPGFTDLMDSVAAELNDAYLDSVETQLAAMDFDYGVQISAGLGPGNRIADIVLHPPPRRRRFGFDRRSDNSFRVIEEPEVEFDPVMGLRGRTLSVIADVVNDAADHVQEFFLRLRSELAFYLGCVALYDRLSRAGLPLCLPTPHPAGTPRLRCAGLRDAAMSVGGGQEVVGNDIDAMDRSLIVVTGANSGGKSTLLRSIGAARVMMQAGMFVIADSFEADVRDGVFTHFVTDEDRTMSHGKLVDELARMSRAVDRMRPNSVLLCNESFSSTSERDAAKIIAPLVDALLGSGVAVILVTHLYEYAHQRYQFGNTTDLFLRADHLSDGTRTFRFAPAPPGPTSHANDVFERVFGRAPDEWPNCSVAD